MQPFPEWSWKLSKSCNIRDLHLTSFIFSDGRYTMKTYWSILKTQWKITWWHFGYHFEARGHGILQKHIEDHALNIFQSHLWRCHTFLWTCLHTTKFCWCLKTCRLGVSSNPQCAHSVSSVEIWLNIWQSSVHSRFGSWLPKDLAPGPAGRLLALCSLCTVFGTGHCSLLHSIWHCSLCTVDS